MNVKVAKKLIKISDSLASIASEVLELQIEDAENTSEVIMDTSASLHDIASDIIYANRC